MDWNKVVRKWQKRFGLTDWTIEIEKILSGAVEYPDDIGDDNYYIGIEKNPINLKTKKTTLYHDVPLYEEAIIHELLHIKHPEWSEDEVNRVQDELVKKYKIN